MWPIQAQPGDRVTLVIPPPPNTQTITAPQGRGHIRPQSPNGLLISEPVPMHPEATIRCRPPLRRGTVGSSNGSGLGTGQEALYRCASQPPSGAFGLELMIQLISQHPNQQPSPPPPPRFGCLGTPPPRPPRGICQHPSHMISATGPPEVLNHDQGPTVPPRAFGASQFGPKHFFGTFGASNNSGSPEAGGSPPQPPHPLKETSDRGAHTGTLHRHTRTFLLHVRCASAFPGPPGGVLQIRGGSHTSAPHCPPSLWGPCVRPRRQGGRPASSAPPPLRPPPPSVPDVVSGTHTTPSPPGIVSSHRPGPVRRCCASASSLAV